MQKIKKILSYLTHMSRRNKIIAAVVVVVALVVVSKLMGGTTTPPTESNVTQVEVASVASLSDSGGPLPVTGKVTSVSKANILSPTGGQIVSLPRSLGDQVAAGSVIASFENSSQRAAVLQAQGTYDAAVAAQQSVSPVDAKAAALNAYRAAHNTLDDVLRTDVDVFYGDPGPFGPKLLINSAPYDIDELSRDRAAISNEMRTYHNSLEDAESKDPAQLLAQASTIAAHVSELITKLGVAAGRNNSRASATELAALATARTNINTITATLASAQQTYRSQSVTTTSSTDANVTIALGGLRAAQAALEKTIVRATISGTIVSLPVNMGDFVSAGSLVAAISNPGALQVEAYVTSDDAKTIAVGGKATLDGEVSGTIVFIAPALDPTTGKIQVQIAIPSSQTALTDGDTVTASLIRSVTTGPKTATNKGITIPIAAAKITPMGPVVFTVEGGVLVSHPIVFGDLVGGQVSVTSGLTPEMIIVKDARGLSDGQVVAVVDAQ